MGFTRRDEVRVALTRATNSAGTVFDRDIYFSVLALAWILLLPILAVPAIAIGYLVDVLANVRAGAGTATSVTFIAAFCLTGGADAFLRLLLVSLGERRYKRRHWTADRQVRAILRLSAVTEITLPMQLALGIFFAWRFG